MFLIILADFANCADFFVIDLQNLKDLREIIFN